MEPDHKASQGAFGAAASTKKRQISFRLAIPSKRPKLPYEQRTAASTFTSFYVEGGTNATPETPSSGTTNWDDDPFYDQDTELAAATASSGLQSHYSKTYYHDAFQVAPQFSDPVPIIDLAGTQDDSARSSLGSSHTHSDLEQDVFDRLQKAYEVVQSQDLFKDSPVWSTLLEAKLNAPSDPRFTPKLMDALTSKLQVSVVLNLYASGFSFDEQEQIYPYARNTISVLDAINYGILVGQLENSLPKTLATVVDGVSKPAQLYFYDGGIIVEVRDYREGRAKMNPTTQTMIPNKTKLFLRPDHHGILHYIDSQPVQPRIRSIVEQGIVYYLHPDLHLNPDVEQTRFLHALHSSFQKANIPYKQRIAKRRATFMPSRSVHAVPSVLSYSGEDELLAEEAEAASSTPPSLIDPSQTTMDTTDPAVPPENADAVTANEGPTKPLQTLPQHPSTTTAPIASAPSRLFKHLQSINFAMDYHKEADSGQTHSEKKRPYAVRSDPTLKEPVLSHPQVVGHFLFTIQQRAGGMQGGQPPLDYATLEINNRSAGGTQPFEMMHTSLRYGNGKALHFQSGGPASTSRLLNQFKKLETPATNEQVKHWQTPPAAQAPRMPTGPNAPGMPAVGPNMGSGAGMPNQQQGHPGGPAPPSASSPHPGHGHQMTGSGPMQAMPGSSSGPNAGGAMDQHAGMMSLPGSSSSPHAGQHMPQNTVGAVRGGMPGQQQQHPQGGQARPLMPGMPGVASVPPSQGQPQGGPPMQHPGMAGVVRPKQPMPGAPGSVMAPQGGQGQQVMYQGKPNPNMPGQQPSAGGQPSMGMMNMQQGMGGAHPGGGMPGQHQQHQQHLQHQGPLQGSPHGLQQGQGGMQQSSRPPVGSVAAPMPGMIKHTLPTGQPMGANVPGTGANAKYGSPMPVGSAPLHGSAGMPRPITAATTKFAVGAPTASSTAATGGATASMASRPVGVKVATPVSASSGPGQNPNASPASPYTAAGNRRAPKKK